MSSAKRNRQGEQHYGEKKLQRQQSRQRMTPVVPLPTSVASMCDLHTTPADCRALLAPPEQQQQENGSERRIVTLEELRVWRRKKAHSSSIGGRNRTISVAHMELLRLHRVRQLRQEYETLCRELLGIPAPRESFNRWLFERRLEQTMYDPLIPPYRVDKPVSLALHHELLESTPYRLNMQPRDTGRAVRDLRQFMEAARALLTKHAGSNFDQAEMDQYRAEIDNAERWLSDRRYPRRSMEELLDCMRSLKDRVGDPMKRKLQHLAEEICTSLSERAQVKLDELKEDVARAVKEVEEAPEKRQTVQVSQMQGEVRLMFGDSVCRIAPLHFEKLFELFKLHEHEGSSGTEGGGNVQATNRAYEADKEHRFNEYVFALLHRYDAFFGDGKFEGTGFQAALPTAVFHVLTKEFGVATECFASPLNCHYTHFCSAFEDMDAPFGSLGSFFNFLPTQGSYEANPPFTIEVMDEMVAHMEMLLSRSDDPLSFIVFVPAWSDAPPLERMESLQWLTHKLVVEAQEHTYVSGAQHQSDAMQREYPAIHATNVYFLQNKAGRAKWPPDVAKIEKLRNAFKANALPRQ